MSNALARFQGALSPLSKVKPESVLDAYLQGQTTQDIANSLGVHRSALQQWLYGKHTDAWRTAQIVKAQERKALAEDDLDKARLDLKAMKKGQKPGLCLARVRVAETNLNAAQWDLERIFKREYGQDQPVSAGQGVTINIGIQYDAGAQLGASSQPAVIDVEPNQEVTKAIR